MNTSPRRNRLALVLLFACASFPRGLHAQERTRRPAAAQGASATAEPKQTSPNTRPNTRAAKARETRERRQALALLTEATEAARAFTDLSYRAEIQSHAADILWPFDEASARALLTRAWESATEADAEAQKDWVTGPDSHISNAVTDSRAGVLTIVGRHDPQLADKYMAEIVRDEVRLNEVDETDAGSRFEYGWRLNLAYALLQDGNYEAAARAVRPLSAHRATPRLMAFLQELRARFPTGADEIYTRLLEGMRADARAGAPAVLLLSSYIVSPGLVVEPDDYGSVRFRSLNFRPSVEESRAPPPVPAHVRALFFRTAASVLVRLAGAQAGANSKDASVLFFTIGRLLPHFEREAPQYAAQLQARRAALVAELDAARRERLAAQSELESLAPKNTADPLASRLDSIAHARDDAERDRRRSALVRDAARRRLWDRARSVSAEITDQELRREALSVIASEQVLTIGEGFKEDADLNDWERAAAFVRAADVTPAVRALGLVQVAHLTARRGHTERAAEILSEAAGIAEQIESGAPEKLGVFNAVAVAASSLDTPRAGEFLAAAIRAANQLNDSFDLYVFLLFKPASWRATADDESGPFRKSPSLADVFTAAARVDFARAVAESRTLEDEVTRSFAQLAVARTRFAAGAIGVRRAGEKK